MKRKLRSDERFEITAIARDGQPIEPIRTKEAFAAQCGVLVRDKISISIQQCTTREKPSSSAGFGPISSAGRGATDKALQLMLSNSASGPMLLLN